jgi:hypothetical protein
MKFYQDVWVLDAYLDEAGWDGQHQQLYFSTKRDAEAFGRIITDRVKTRVGNGDQRVDYEVYKVEPFESFKRRGLVGATSQDTAAIEAKAIEIADEWLEGLDL